MNSQLCYVSTGINQSEKSLDWNFHLDLIAHSACNYVVLYDPNDASVQGVSQDSHGSHINSVQWLHSIQSCQTFLLTTSTDGTAKVWSFIPHSEEPGVEVMLKSFALLKGHTGSVSCGYGAFTYCWERELEHLFVITTAADFCIKGWKINIQTGISEGMFTYKLPGRSLALDLLVIENLAGNEARHWPIVCYAGDDKKVHLMTSRDGLNYEVSCCLSGHEDWITSLAFLVDGKNGLLSSGSKDGFIRLWKLGVTKEAPENEDCDLLRAEEMQIIVPLWSVEKQAETGSLSVRCSLESVLCGHDGLVSCLAWWRDDKKQENPILLSCAKTEDRSIAVWAPEADPSSHGCYRELWVEKARLGEVGGNREGFLNTKIGPSGDLVAATSYQGGLHLWYCQDGSWRPRSVVSGHFKEVVDLDWAVNGSYLLTVSKDQTTRLHALIGCSEIRWQEIARPQVHGYDMACIAHLRGFTFASGGEEKVIRSFCSTADFAQRLNALSPDITKDCFIDIKTLPGSASVPSLGLSNKVAGSNSKPIVFDEERWKEPPNEDELMMGTLWPETAKLYGHGNELVTLAASHDGSLLASSCRATSEQDAKIIVWDTDTWAEICSINHHRLTVTQMEFSPCDEFLLSVSRDRTWAVFRRCSTTDSKINFVIKFHSGALEKKYHHSRIIWTCAWLPNSLCFVTGSRDKTIALWTPKLGAESVGAPNEWERAVLLQEPQEVTALATKLNKNGKDFLLAVGYVTGLITLRTMTESGEVNSVVSDIQIYHRKTVRRMKFRPSKFPEETSSYLASAGDDNSVMIHKISN